MSKYCYNELPLCPYCDKEDTDTDIYGLRFDGDSTTKDCPHFEKEYNVTMHVSYEYSTLGIACNNHKLFLKAPYAMLYGCTVCKREYYDWQLAGGKHQQLTELEYEIVLKGDESRKGKYNERTCLNISSK